MIHKMLLTFSVFLLVTGFVHHSILGSRVAFGCKGDSATAAPVAGIADLGMYFVSLHSTNFVVTSSNILCLFLDSRNYYFLFRDF